MIKKINQRKLYQLGRLVCASFLSLFVVFLETKFWYTNITVQNVQHVIFLPRSYWDWNEISVLKMAPYPYYWWIHYYSDSECCLQYRTNKYVRLTKTNQNRLELFWRNNFFSSEIVIKHNSCIVIHEFHHYIYKNNIRK